MLGSWFAAAARFALFLSGAMWPGELERAVAALHSADRQERLAALERVGAADAARPALRGLLTDPDPHVREGALRLLMLAGDAAALDHAISWVAAGALHERSAGLEALRLASPLPPAAYLALDRALVDTDVNTRLSALEALAGKDVRPVLPKLAGLLEDGAPQVRLRAVRLLASAGDTRATLPLVGRLDDADKDVQRAALLALGAVNDRRAAQALLRTLHLGSAELKGPALDALAALGDRGAVEAIAALATRRPADAMARQAQRALGELGGEAAVETLVALLGQPPVASETRDALVRLGTAAVSDLMAATTAEPPLASEAARLLGRIGDRRAVGPLLVLLARRDAALLDAVAALRALRAAEAVPHLALLSNDRSQELRRRALEALVAIADDRAMTALGDRLSDGDPGVRRLATRLAGRLRAKGHEAQVAARLLDDDPETRAEAVRALGHAGGPGSVAAIVRALPELAGDWTTVGEALRRLARPEDLSQLTKVLRGASRERRDAIFLGIAAAATRSGHVSRGEERKLAGVWAAELTFEGASAELAAEALSTRAAAGRRPPAEVSALFELVRPAVRERLCGARLRLPGGEERLSEALHDADEADRVRAAAAWALAGAHARGKGAALAAAARSLHPAVAANARAALATAQPGKRATTFRLVGRDGRPQPNEWLIVAADGAAVWAVTGMAGQVRIEGLSGQQVAVVAARPELTLEHATDGVWKIAGDEHPSP